MRAIERWRAGELSVQEALEEIGGLMEERMKKNQPVNDLQRDINQILGMAEEPAQRDLAAEALYEGRRRS